MAADRARDLVLVALVTGLETLAASIAALTVLGVGVAVGVAALARSAKRLGGSQQREEDLRQQAARRTKADELGAQPPPSLQEMDDWDRGKQ